MRLRTACSQAQLTCAASTCSQRTHHCSLTQPPHTCVLPLVYRCAARAHVVLPSYRTSQEEIRQGLQALRAAQPEAAVVSLNCPRMTSHHLPLDALSGLTAVTSLDAGHLQVEGSLRNLRHVPHLERLVLSNGSHIRPDGSMFGSVDGSLDFLRPLTRLSHLELKSHAVSDSERRCRHTLHLCERLPAACVQPACSLRAACVQPACSLLANAAPTAPHPVPC